MFFGQKNSSETPPEQTLEQYSQSLYDNLQCGEDATYFDALVVDAFSYIWMVAHSGQSRFLVANELAKADVIIATMFINQRLFLSGIDEKKIREKYLWIYCNKTVKVLLSEFPQTKPYIDDMINNRMEFYNRLIPCEVLEFEQMEAVFQELQNILIQDREDKEYVPYSETSPLMIPDFRDLLQCQGEVDAFKNVFLDVFSEMNFLLNNALKSVQADEEEIEQDYNELFDEFRSALLRGLNSYIAAHPSPVLEKFREKISQDLECFLKGGMQNEYVFSIAVRSANNMECVDFNMEENVIEVSCGGSEYTEEVGFDSYTDWQYTIWSDGTEGGDACLDCLNTIAILFGEDEAHFSIEQPEELYYDSEMDSEEKEENFFSSEQESTNNMSGGDSDNSYTQYQNRTSPVTRREMICAAADQILSEGVVREEAAALIQYLERNKELEILLDEWRELWPRFEEAEKLLRRKAELSKATEALFTELEQEAKQEMLKRILKRSEEIFWEKEKEESRRKLEEWRKRKKRDRDNV